MDDGDLLDRLEELDADTIYFIRRADKKSWVAHVRHPEAGPSRYDLGEASTLRESIEAVLGIQEETEWGHLI